MLELQFDKNASPKMEFENERFPNSENTDNSLDDFRVDQLAMNVHANFTAIFKGAFEKLVKKPDLKNLEKLLEVVRIW